MRFTCIFVLFVSYVACTAGHECRTVYDKGLSKAEQDSLVNKHNDFRLLVAQGKLENQPKASNMKRMFWDNALAAEAQRITDTCVYGHAPAYDPRFAVGQNIALWVMDQAMDANERASNWTFPMTAWFVEHETYKFGTTQYSHYTQLVWADTIYVGCGYTEYMNTTSPLRQWFYVCNYGPAGNYYGQTPYKIGNGCENLC